jgi:hypothetical protein
VRRVPSSSPRDDAPPPLPQNLRRVPQNSHRRRWRCLLRPSCVDEQPRDNDGAKRLLSARGHPQRRRGGGVSARRIGTRKNCSSVWWMACSFADTKTALAASVPSLSDLAGIGAAAATPHYLCLSLQQPALAQD